MKKYMEGSVYERLFDIKPLINLAGIYTKLGGSIPPSEVVEATAEASRYFVDMGDLIKRSGEVVAKALGVPAAYLTSGSSAGISLSTAACMTGTDPAKARQLPYTKGMKNEVIIQRGHYAYNFMVGLTGANIIYVGEETPESEYPKWPAKEYPRFDNFNNRPEHLEAAINEKTCAIFHLITGDVMVYGEPFGEVSLQEVGKIARKYDIPLIVDAADQVPPMTNFKKIMDMGGDLVVVSGGKAISCFNDTGIIVGRKDLIDACAINGPPNHAIGRGFKIGKEQIVALTVAIQRYNNLDMDAELIQEKGRAEYVLKLVKELPHVKGVELMYPDETGIHDKYVAQIQFDEEKLGMTVKEVYEDLQAGDPSIVVCGRYLHAGKIGVETKVWKDYEGLRIFVEKLREILTKKA